MLEKDIENLIALYPDEFFSKAGFRLKGQQVKLGSCYADILFIDKYDRTVIVEVKRGILSRDGAGQIIEYYGLLKQQNPNSIIELVLCANTIPHERKLFLEQVGIDCKELGIALILNVAEKHGYKFLDEVKKESKEIGQKYETHLPKITEEDISLRADNNVWIFQANPERFDILNALSDPNLQTQCWQINQHMNKIKKGDIAMLWMSGKESGIYAVAEVVSDPLILPDFPEEEKYWIHDEDRGIKRLKVIIKTKNTLINKPIYRHELKAIQELRNLSILRFSQGTNFSVSMSEWKIIKEKINEKINS